jgi:hypothetical protein
MDQSKRFIRCVVQVEYIIHINFFTLFHPFTNPMTASVLFLAKVYLQAVGNNMQISVLNIASA